MVVWAPVAEETLPLESQTDAVAESKNPEGVLLLPNIYTASYLLNDDNRKESMSQEYNYFLFPNMVCPNQCPVVTTSKVPSQVLDFTLYIQQYLYSIHRHVSVSHTVIVIFHLYIFACVVSLVGCYTIK